MRPITKPKNINGILVRLPIIDRLFYKVKHRQIKGEKGIRSRIQQVAHKIDRHISNNAQAPYDAIKEFEFLIKEMQNKKIAVDEAICWSLTIFAIGKYGLQNLYLQNLIDASSSIEIPYGQANLLASIKDRRSIRKWTDEQIDRDDIKEVIDIAKWAPSSCNRQLWQVLLIERKQDKEFLLEYFNNDFWLSAPVLMVILMNARPYHETEKHYAYLDAGAFIQNILLALHSKGYGACWIGFMKWNTLNSINIDTNHHKKFYEYFRLSSEVIPVSMIAVGKPAIKPKAPFRQSISNIIIEDR
jgi:nitroreductase